ncbi:MAG: hypothetical protein SOW84_01295 [Candidatus Faecousia sp.]|nr:hypothetical protein [Candidatus Faecousia sp.]
MKHKPTTRRLLTTSLLLALLALVSITAATAAWMTIADRTRVRSMRMEITSGANLRFDLDPHESFEQYVKTLSFREIAQRIARDKGFDPKDNPLTPVTTRDCVHFTLEDGSEAKKEYYLEFTLHFMATEDMVVHLTSAGGDGTRIESPTAALPKAMRLSFTAEQTSIYDPGLGDTTSQSAAGRTFGLPEGGAMTYHDGNALFSLKAGVDKPVVMRVWLEGTDEACTDALRGADYSIRLRFIGTDENGNLLEDPRASRQKQEKGR